MDDKWFRHRSTRAPQKVALERPSSWGRLWCGRRLIHHEPLRYDAASLLREAGDYSPEWYEGDVD